MKIIKPAYYDTFRCIAGACPDSCCKEWDVQVDDASAACYRSLPGALGDRLREVLKDEDGETVMTIENGRCPMWRQDGLCRIQAELGEEALCRTCRQFPRLTHEYGDFTELGLELSCPEAAKLILSDFEFAAAEEEIPGAEAPEYDTEAMAALQTSRAMALTLLELPIGEALTALLLYGYQAQNELDGDEIGSFDAAAAIAAGKDHAAAGNPADFSAFFRKLEILTPEWRDLLDRLHAPQLTGLHNALAGYLINRYWLQAVSDYDLVCRVKFIVISCLLVSMLPGDPLRTTQLFSKEIENDVDNLDAILDAAYTCEAFADNRLLGLLQSQL